MASGADDSGVPGSGDSDQAVEANGASRWADWTLNRVLVVAGVVLGVLAPGVFCTTHPFFVGPPPLLLLSGVVWAGLLLLGPPPGVYAFAGGAHSLFAGLP